VLPDGFSRVPTDNHFVAEALQVERGTPQANLVTRPEDWRRSSFPHRRR